VTSRKGPDLSLEAAHPWPVCGVDEAGRGPWAGPVSAAAVILDPARTPAGLDDSKKLGERRREALEVEIKASALAWGSASPASGRSPSLTSSRRPAWP
jgi:ribonuclease HII